MTRKFYHIDRNGRKWSVLLKIQQASTVFAKIDMTQHKITCFSSCLRFLWNNSRSCCIFLSKLWKVSQIQNPDPPCKESWAKTQPLGSENVRILGGPSGGGMVRLGFDWYIIQRKAVSVFFLLKSQFDSLGNDLQTISLCFYKISAVMAFRVLTHQAAYIRDKTRARVGAETEKRPIQTLKFLVRQ